MRPDRRQLLAAAVAAPIAGRVGGTIDAGALGARGDGRTLATCAIQAALDRAAPSGGRVTLPPGTYLTGSLFVRGGTTLEIGRGVTLLGSRDLADYPRLPTRVAGIETAWPAALVNIYGETGASITGEGTIDGDGEPWWTSYRALRARYDPRGLRWAADYDCERPRLIQIYGARDAFIGGGLRLHRSGFWTVHVCYSQGVHLADLLIRNNIGGRGPSTDGIDIDSSSRVLVERCDISCNDDALCLKAGRDADGLRVDRPTTAVVIRDCTVRDGAAGVTFGSETAGGIRDVRVERLRVFGPTPTGVLFKSARTRGGGASDVLIRDVMLRDVPTALSVNLDWNPSYSYATLPPGIDDPPPLWTTLTTGVAPERGIPHVHDVTIERLSARGCRRAFAVAAYPDAPVARFQLADWSVDAPDGGRIADARDWSGRRLALAARPAVERSSGMHGL